MGLNAATREGLSNCNEGRGRHTGATRMTSTGEGAVTYCVQGCKLNWATEGVFEQSFTKNSEVVLC